MITLFQLRIFKIKNHCSYQLCLIAKGCNLFYGFYTRYVLINWRHLHWLYTCTCMSDQVLLKYSRTSTRDHLSTKATFSVDRLYTEHWLLFKPLSICHFLLSPSLRWLLWRGSIVPLGRSMLRFKVKFIFINQFQTSLILNFLCHLASIIYDQK